MRRGCRTLLSGCGATGAVGSSCCSRRCRRRFEVRYPGALAPGWSARPAPRNPTIHRLLRRKGLAGKPVGGLGAVTRGLQRLEGQIADLDGRIQRTDELVLKGVLGDDDGRLTPAAGPPRPRPAGPGPASRPGRPAQPRGHRPRALPRRRAAGLGVTPHRGAAGSVGGAVGSGDAMRRRDSHRLPGQGPGVGLGRPFGTPPFGLAAGRPATPRRHGSG